tara:strand:+ start:4723 stop:4965 length:243 start_codon:yes stop_codon:yes gene_type:complete
MANFTIANLTTAVVGTAATQHYNRQADYPADDSKHTVSNGTMTVWGSNNFGNFNELDRVTVSHNDDKRPGKGILYPRGGQ